MITNNINLDNLLLTYFGVLFPL